MNQYYPFEVVPLPYSYLSMIPCCDANTLYFHHNQYYQSAVDRLNQLVVRHRLTHLSLEELLTADINLPVAQVDQIQDAAGAVYNHQLYFDSITPAPVFSPHSPLAEKLTSTYGSIHHFFQLLTEAAASIHGSGWLWLVSEGTGDLHLVTTKDNQTVPLSSVHPIFLIDLWEHAYSVHHHFDLNAYLLAWLSNLDWQKANQRFLSAHALRPSFAPLR